MKLARFNLMNLFVKQWSYMHRDTLASLVLRWSFWATLLKGLAAVRAIGRGCFLAPRFKSVFTYASLLALYIPLCSTGHEHPFSIALNCLRDSVDQQQGTNNNTLLADGSEASFLEQLPKEKQCQFVLKPRLQVPLQLKRGRSCRSASQPDRFFCFTGQCQILPSIVHVSQSHSHTLLHA